MIKTDNKLQDTLEDILATYTPKERLGFDPLQFPHRFRDPADIEIAAFLSALFAFGNVKQILATLEAVFKILGDHPVLFIKNFYFNKDSSIFDSITHRWIRGKDLAHLISLLQHVLLKHRSLYNLFLAGYSQTDNTIRGGLLSFNNTLLSFSYPAAHAYNTKGFRFFFADPASGSPCKRWNLFLRWMIRDEKGLDFGLWKGIQPSKLIVPLDTHIAKIGQHLGLTSKKSPSWKMAEEITDSLKKFDKNDPVKYDFALCHFGISKDFIRFGVK